MSQFSQGFSVSLRDIKNQILPCGIVVGFFTLLVTFLVLSYQAVEQQEYDKIMADSDAALMVEFGRFRNRNTDNFSGPNDTEEPDFQRRRRFLDPERPKLFDGSFMRNLGLGLMWVSGGLLSLAFTVSLIWSKLKG